MPHLAHADAARAGSWCCVGAGTAPERLLSSLLHQKPARSAMAAATASASRMSTRRAVLALLSKASRTARHTPAEDRSSSSRTRGARATRVLPPNPGSNLTSHQSGMHRQAARRHPALASVPHRETSTHARPVESSRWLSLHTTGTITGCCGELSLLEISLGRSSCRASVDEVAPPPISIGIRGPCRRSVVA